MKILANYQRKVGRENYGSETFCVTFETDTEGAFNNISEVSDYLFNQARAAVQRQIDGTATNTQPETSIPESDVENEGAGSSSNTNQSGNNGKRGLPITSKQQEMIHKMVGEIFPDRSEGYYWLKSKVGTNQVEMMTRKQASRAIEALIERRRSKAA